MANQLGRQVDTPGVFDDQPQVAGSLPGLPQDQGQLGAAQQRTGMALEQTIGPIADRLTVEEARTAGSQAGLDPSFRPTGDPTLRGVAFDNAATETYNNQLQSGTRDAIAQAYDTWSQLPEDQKTPGALQTSLQQIHDNAVQNDVFASDRPRFEQMFSTLSYPWLEKAQTTHETFVQNQAKASAQGNISSLQDNTLRLASLGTDAGDVNMAQEQAALGRMIDDQVQRGLMSPEAAQKQKDALTQSLLSTSVLARFDAIKDPAQRAAFLDTFQKGFGTGSSTDYFARLKQQENASGDPNAGNGGGDYQFEPATWASLAAKHPELGLTPGGRTDPAQAARAIVALTNDNKAALAQGGVPPSEANTYMAHFLGAAGATSFIKAMQVNPNAPAAATNQQAAANNPNVFYKGGDPSQPRSLAEVYALQTQRFANPTNGLDASSFSYVQGKMSQAINADQQAAQRATTAGVDELNKAFDQEKKNEPVAPDVYQSLQTKYGASTDPKVMQALSNLTQMHVNAARWATMSNEDLAADIAKQTPSRADGTPRVDVPYLAAANAYLKQRRSDLTTDPLGRAARDGIIPTQPPIDFSQPATIAAGLAARAPAAAQVASNYGIAPPLITQDEKAQLKQISAAGGQPMLDAAKAIVQGLPPDQAGRLLDGVGGEAPAFATAGRIAAWNGSASFLSDFARRQQMAQDPTAKHALELPAKTQTDPVANDTLGDALSQIPSMNAAVRQSARDVYEVRALDQNLDKQLVAPNAQAVFTRGLQEAAGATFQGDQQYGGVGTVKNQGWFGGAQKVLAPLDMKADRVGDALGALTDADYAKLPAPPVAGDGKTPIAADRLAGANLFSMGHGVYQMALGTRTDPQWVRQPNGQRFVLDLNAMEPALRGRLPDLYRTP